MAVPSIVTVTIFDAVIESQVSQMIEYRNRVGNSLTGTGFSA